MGTDQDDRTRRKNRRQRRLEKFGPAKVLGGKRFDFVCTDEVQVVILCPTTAANTSTTFATLTTYATTLAPNL